MKSKVKTETELKDKESTDYVLRNISWLFSKLV